MSRKFFRLSLLLLVTVILVSGCNMPWKKKAAPADQSQPTDQSTTTDQNTDTQTTNDLKKFTDYQELKTFLEEHASGGGLTYGSPTLMRGMAENLAVKSMAPIATDSVGATSGSSANNVVSQDSSVPNNTLDYSGTNNQVAGVDEADIIKTDGNYIYALVRNELSIVKANPAGEAAVVSKITFKSRPQGILINGKNIAVFGSDEQIYAQPLYRSFRRQNPYTFFKVFDLSDPANPKQVRDLDFEGSYISARLIGDYVYFISSNYAYYVDKEPLTPRVISNGEVLANACGTSTNCFMPDVYYFDIPYNSYNYTSVSAINLRNANEAITGQVYLLDNSQNIYVSGSNIYLTYTQYLNEYDLEQMVKKDLVYPKLTAADQDRIVKIEAVPGFILNANEKKVKTALIIDRYLSSLSAEEQSAQQTEIDTALKNKMLEKAKEMEKTIIHKIAISGQSIEYRAKGEVSGQVLNQFSMDENGNYFRIATTRNQLWSRLADTSQDSYNNIYVLDADLKVVGSLENLATTEKIYAARFMGDRVYMVTFKRTDPLYVIGLSDPSKPAVLGAIKIPGFSNYLHPTDASGSKLIGLGREVEENTNGSIKIKGLKLSLFDFSDLAHPKEADSFVIGDERSDSIALSDHQAFLYSAAKNLLVVPSVTRDSTGNLSFAGALVFSITDNRFNLRGRIDHSEGGHFSQVDYWRGFDYYDNTVKRSLYIGDSLFTFSNKFLKINSLADLAPLKNVELTAGSDFIITPSNPGTINPPAISPETPASPPVSDLPENNSTSTPDTGDGTTTPQTGTSTNP